MPWLFLAYPLLAHLAALLHSQALAGLALVVFIAIPLLPQLLHGRRTAWLVLLASATTLVLLARSGLAMQLIYLPPILIPLSVCLVFAGSLRAGHTPLVSQLAARIRGTALPPELERYTRRVTQVWAAVLACLVTSSLLFALFASRELWSLMTNLVMYLILGAMFVLEYGYRRWRFRHLEHERFATMVGALFKGGVR